MNSSVNPIVDLIAKDMTSSSVHSHSEYQIKVVIVDDNIRCPDVSSKIELNVMAPFSTIINEDYLLSKSFKLDSDSSSPKVVEDEEATVNDKLDSDLELIKDDDDDFQGKPVTLGFRGHFLH
jgi:uncharacterized protein (UPF0262 family)